MLQDRQYRQRGGFGAQDARAEGDYGIAAARREFQFGFGKAAFGAGDDLQAVAGQ